MTEPNQSRHRSTGWPIGVAAGVGTSLGAMVGSVTGDWSWTPIVLSACMSLGVIAAWRTQTTGNAPPASDDGFS